MTHKKHGDGGKLSENRSNSKEYRDNYDKVDYSKPVNTASFTIKVNGKEVKK